MAMVSVPPPEDFDFARFDVYLYVHEEPPRPDAYLLIEKAWPNRLLFICPEWLTFSGLHGRGEWRAGRSQLHLYNFRYLGARADWFHQVLFLRRGQTLVLECSFCYYCRKNIRAG